ncbi:MAG: hypothetical protein IJC59_04315, partial [Lachnospiraceae bacterium]|nr:hypothetical protein [Lachnospiraceae bacterium]
LRITLRDASGFGIYELAASGSPKELFYLPYPDADLWIHSAVLSQDGRKVYYCLQNGTILCDSLDEGTTEAVYSSTVVGGRESVPKELSPGSGERIYFTDLGFRDIGMIDGKEISWMWEKSSLDQADFLEQEIFEAVNGERALTGCSRYSAYVIREGKPVALTTLELSITAMAASMISKIALGIICVLALYYLLYFVRIFFQRSKLLARVIFVLCLAVGIMGVLFVHTALPKYKALMLTELENRIGDVGYLVAQRIPSDHLLALDSVKDYRNEDYLAVKERVDEMFFSGNGLSDFYCVIYTVREDVITVNYCSKDNCGARYPYDWRFEGSDEQEIMETGRGKIFTNRSSFEGSYSFSLSPIFGEEGEVVGLAEVGVNARQFEEDVNRLTADLMISILVITVVTVLLIIQIFRLSQNKGKEEDE